MPGRFALRFSDERGDDGQAVNRRASVHRAFNSPFWPFVLASTSVGQEGLDFHLYSHAVVHWNLPANPVDLEQREGRVHRYKGHAVRKNVAAACRPAAFTGGDPWAALSQPRSSRPERRDRDRSVLGLHLRGRRPDRAVRAGAASQSRPDEARRPSARPCCLPARVRTAAARGPGRVPQPTPLTRRDRQPPRRVPHRPLAAGSSLSRTPSRGRSWINPS